MANSKPSNGGPTNRRNNAPLLSAENTKARRTIPVQKKAAPCNTRRRGQKTVMDTNSENVDSTAPNRRSSRLNGTALDVAATAQDTDSTTNVEVLVDKANVPVKRKTAGRKTNANQGGRKQRGCSLSGDDVGGAPTDEDAQSDTPTNFEEIQDLRQQLQQEKGFRHAKY
jgi:hypothetical protein